MMVILSVEPCNKGAYSASEMKGLNLFFGNGCQLSCKVFQIAPISLVLFQVLKYKPGGQR